MTTTSTDPDPALAELLDRLHRDRWTELAVLRNWLDREERQGATVVRIEHVRAFFGWGKP